MVDVEKINYKKNWTEFLESCQNEITGQNLIVEGKLTRIIGLTIEAAGCQAAIGERCLIQTQDDNEVEAEVVGFSGNKTYLMPINDMHGLVPGSRVRPCRHEYQVPVGKGLLGRILDGGGKPIDSKGTLTIDDYRTLLGIPINPLKRMPITEKFDTGIRAVNGLLTVGVGQRMGLFASSGVGKSVLLGMLARYANADVIVVGLIGERGREVNEFIQEILGEQGLQRAVVVAVPADRPPLLRLHGAMLATSIAEYFCEQGQQVLLLMDSLTRFAQAQREIALAVGEPPATKGYPPSVFTKLPHLVERAGNNDEGRGSITGFYTVLIEGEDYSNDPIADAAKAVLDGHIVLSREMAEQGYFPAINLEASVSRSMTSICSQTELHMARYFKQLYFKYQENKDLINIGMYEKGTNEKIDEAVDKQSGMINYLCQDMHEMIPLDQSIQQLQVLLQPAQ